MLHRVVKPFPFSEDGFTLIDLNEGDERDFGSHGDGLAAIGWIEPIDAEVAAELAEGEQIAGEQPAPRVRGRRK